MVISVAILLWIFPKSNIVFIFENSPERVDDNRDAETLTNLAKYWQDYIVEKEKAIDQKYSASQ